MVDETPEQIQQEMFDQALAPEPTPAPEPEPAPAEPTAPETPAPAAAEPEAAVPTWRLREEAERARLAEARAAVMEQRLQEVAAHLRQQQPQPDFFDDPGRATQDQIVKMLQPFAEETRKQMMAMGKMVASVRHGEDKVDEAERAFLEMHEKQTLDPADYERVVQASNRYDAVVQWHRRQNTLAAVGDDPNAWFEKQLEARMADPKFQAQLMEKARAGAASRLSETRLPPSLSRSTAAKSNDPGPVGDMSDASLWAHAMSPKTRQ